jgi:hypothetical protein
MACSGAATLRVGRVNVDAVPSAAELLAALRETLAEASALQAALAGGGVRNAGVIARRVQRDQKFLLGRIDSISDLTLAEAQGILNNLRGTRAEMAACRAAPGVVAIAQRFRGPSGNVEADVVAHGGAAWIEVKCQEQFGADSAHAVALREQLRGMLAAAAAPQNFYRWRPPAVAFFSPSPISEDVASSVRALGVTVISGAGGALTLRGFMPRTYTTLSAHGGMPRRCRSFANSTPATDAARLADAEAALRSGLPPPPPPPDAVNLDVTTLCALVSEVSHRPPGDAAIDAWAARTVHWRTCAAAEAASPLLAELSAFLAVGRPLLASPCAVAQFELLLGQFGGVSERARWAALKAGRLRVVDHAAAAATTAAQLGADGAHARDVAARMMRLPGLGAPQLAVFSLGELARATTLTANGASVRHASQAGIQLETHIHRPVWLTGL